MDLPPHQGAGGCRHAKGGGHVNFACACRVGGVSEPMDGGRDGGVRSATQACMCVQAYPVSACTGVG